MKKILSFLLAAAVLFSLCTVFASAEDVIDLGSVSIERTLGTSPIEDTKLYRFVAKPLDTDGKPYAGRGITYTWYVYYNGGLLVSHTRQQNLNHFAFEPPGGLPIPGDYKVRVVASLSGGNSVESSSSADPETFRLERRLTLAEKEALGLKDALIDCCFRSRNRYTVQSWAIFEAAYKEASWMWVDGSYSVGNTLGGLSDIDRIKYAVQWLYTTSTVVESGDGLHLDQSRMEGFLGTFYPIMERVSEMIYGFLGIKFGDPKPPFKGGLLGDLF